MAGTKVNGWRFNFLDGEARVLMLVEHGNRWKLLLMESNRGCVSYRWYHTGVHETHVRHELAKWKKTQLAANPGTEVKRVPFSPEMVSMAEYALSRDADRPEWTVEQLCECVHPGSGEFRVASLARDPQGRFFVRNHAPSSKPKRAVAFTDATKAREFFAEMLSDLRGEYSLMPVNCDPSLLPDADCGAALLPPTAVATTALATPDGTSLVPVLF